MQKNNIRRLSIPTVTHAQRLFYPHKFAENFHVDSNNEIIHIIDGEIKLQFKSGEEYIGQKNDTLLIPHGVYHRDMFKINKGLEAFHIVFSWNLADKLFKKAAPDCVKNLSAHAKNEVILLFDMIRMSAGSCGMMLTEVRLAHLLGLIWENVFNVNNEENHSDNFSQIANYAKDYMRANLSRNININDVAEHLHVSRSTLIRAFRRSSELSFNSYLKLIRMQEAHALLLERGLNSADCAAQCGFSDPSYFSKVFKKHFGFSPKNCK